MRLLFCRAVKRAKIAIVGPGRLGMALAQALAAAGYRLDEIVFRRSVSRKKTGHGSEQNARKLARPLAEGTAAARAAAILLEVAAENH